MKKNKWVDFNLCIRDLRQKEEQKNEETIRKRTNYSRLEDLHSNSRHTLTRFEIVLMTSLRKSLKQSRTDTVTPVGRSI